MRKGRYLFLECGPLCVRLIIAAMVSFLLAVVIILVNEGPRLPPGLTSNHYYFEAHHAWCLFFLLLGIVLCVANACVQKLCEDFASLLKTAEDKYAEQHLK